MALIQAWKVPRAGSRKPKYIGSIFILSSWKLIWTKWLKNAQTKPDHGACSSYAGGFCSLLLANGCVGCISRSRDSLKAWMRLEKGLLCRHSTGVCIHSTTEPLPRYSSCMLQRDDCILWRYHSIVPYSTNKQDCCLSPVLTALMWCWAVFPLTVLLVRLEFASKKEYYLRCKNGLEVGGVRQWVLGEPVHHLLPFFWSFTCSWG